MADIVWRRRALDDLDEIVAYIDRFDLAAADRIMRRLIDCAESLSQFPHRGRPITDGSCEMTTVPPYVLRYEVQEEIVYILRVRHGARRPD